MEESRSQEKLNVQLLRKEAERRSGWGCVAVGLLSSPLALSFTWFLSGDSGAVRKVGMSIFYVSSILFALAFLRFSHYSGKPKILGQIDFVMIRGLVGPIKDEYSARYDFPNFQLSDFETYKKMHAWGGMVFIAFFSLASWLFSINFFRYFVWNS